MPVASLQKGSLSANVRALPQRSSIYRTYRVNAVQVRTLWWWGRQTGNPWSPSEDFEERVRRHHKIMKSRYYKVLRRRALWESEDTYIRPWRHHRLWSSRYCDYKPLSSTGASSQEAKDPDSEQANEAQTIYKDFDAFRAAVDRAIARDPYGTLFGRRLQSPPSSNNSSWTSFSWFSDPKEIKNDQSVKDPDPPSTVTAKNSTERSTSPSESGPGRQAIKQSAMDISEEEYEYDPISMRKVPIKKQSAEPAPKEDPEREHQSAVPDPEKPSQQSKPENPLSEDQSQQPFLKNLFFQEHGVDIPVKTYKPHKVYGYNASEKKSTDESTSLSAKSEGFDSSRKQELRHLMARAKGNNIDTTALFTEITAQSELETTAGETPAPRKTRELPEPDDTLPLFSGTTYEAKARREADTNASDWLVKEGFRQQTGESVNATDAQDSSIDEPIRAIRNRLEPALDRVKARAVHDQKGKLTRLQTAIDREISASMRPARSPEKEARAEAAVMASKEEKADTEVSKMTSRAKLETDFEARQQEAANEGIASPRTLELETPTNKLTKTLNNVWEHIREYPNGIVAKTMKSMTNFNENYKKYIRPDAVKGLTDKLVFKDESLRNTPSIYKSSPKPQKLAPFTPSHNVLADEKEGMQRTADLREVTENMKKDAEVEKVQMSRLAADIQAVYESEYGPINPEHRQRAQRSPEAEAVSSTTTSERTPAGPHPLSTASVRPGVTTNPVIDNHISKFEPNFAKLVDEAKQIRAELRDVDIKAQELDGSRQAASQADIKGQIEEAKPPLHKLSDVMQGAKEVRRELHEAQNTIRRIESGRPAIAWSAPQLSGSDFGKKRIDLKAQKGLDAPKATYESVAEKDTNTESGVKIVAPTRSEKELKTVPEPIHTPSGSPVWNDEQPPPIESMKVRKFDSPYLVLTYDKATEKVNFSPMNQPTTEIPKSNNVIGILGRLRNAPEFLKHFQTMQRAGYSLYNGTENMLIFQKKQAEHVTGSTVPKAETEAQSSTDGTMSTTGANVTPQLPGQQAATVLDELPAELNPLPGPAAPTAPPSRPFGNQPKVRRQEKVFSGTIRPNASSSAPSQAPDEKPSASNFDKANADTQSEGLWMRFTRAVKYTLLTLTALSLCAYTIGFVAEGLSAHAQQQKGIDDGEAQGPRKRIVMTGQRPGIFSTESSR
ncbi:hypothetical protein CLAIMM_01614 [Cladophialophora immunda]|nr:hypothetical protein CLAIMM_01614 [Cladophialophora immunda]